MSMDLSQPSKETLAKIAQMKKRVEQTVNSRIAFSRSREQRLLKLKDKMEELDMTNNEKENYMNQFLTNERKALREERNKISLKDFDLIKVIGKGAFGEVRVVKYKKD